MANRKKKPKQEEQREYRIGARVVVDGYVYVDSENPTDDDILKAIDGDFFSICEIVDWELKGRVEQVYP